MVQRALEQAEVTRQPKYLGCSCTCWPRVVYVPSFVQD
jgi:hypothetical protein